MPGCSDQQIEMRLAVRMWFPETSCLFQYHITLEVCTNQKLSKGCAIEVVRLLDALGSDDLWSRVWHDGQVDVTCRPLLLRPLIVGPVKDRTYTAGSAAAGFLRATAGAAAAGLLRAAFAAAGRLTISMGIGNGAQEGLGLPLT